MRIQFDRRDFLSAAATLSLGATALGRLEAAPPKIAFKKALIGKPDEETLLRLKKAGFDGIESDDRKATTQQAAAARKTADSLGMRIHSMLYGWANFNQSESVANDISLIEGSLRACQAYGADTLLLVPCRLKGMPMPEAWEFKIEFDEKTGRLTRVVEGDNSKYQAYIDAHNQAVDSSRDAVRRLIPTAEKTRVVIALENVWNNLWVQPAYFANFVASFRSPWVKAYFDIGNHVKYAPPEDWIRALGKLIAKCHVKDFKLNPDGHGGKFVPIREGSVNWPAVRAELDAVGYHGWLTIEANDKDLSREEQSKRLDMIIAGE
jgi:L-ribulose-5-phosphate 3-epimerase